MSKNLIKTEKTTIPTGWELIQLGDIFDLTSGKTKPKDTQTDKQLPYPVFGGNGVLGYSSLYCNEDTRIIIGRVGEKCGCIHWENGKCWVTDNALYIKKLKRQINQKYLFKVLGYLNLNKLKKEAGQPLISQGIIYGIKFTCAPLPEQEKIVKVLETWDNYLEKLSEAIKLKKKIKKSLMQKLLRCEVRLPGFNKLWETLEFSECFQVLGKKQGEKKTDYLEKGRFPIIDQSQQKIAGYSNHEELVILKNLPLIIFGDHTRILKIIEHQFVLGNDGTKVFHGKNGFDTKYLFYYLSLISIPNTGYNRHFKYLKDLSIHLPKDYQEQTAIAQILTTADQEIETLEKKKAIIEQQKKFLLNNLITGRIRLPEFTH
ncbi:hypothetical protein C0416_04380 [bacterium]|nr:hypothetical protein [bacterium]